MILASISFGVAAIIQVNIENREDDYYALYNNTSSNNEKDIPKLQDEQISVLWLIPQYVIMTAGEILFSVTGLEFAFKEVCVKVILYDYYCYKAEER